MVSGNTDGSMDVKLPEIPHKGKWKVVFDTSKRTSYKDDKEYQKGDVYRIESHSVVVFANQRPKQKENQNIKPFIIEKRGGR